MTVAGASLEAEGLVQRALEGDDAAWAALYDALAPGVHRFLLGLGVLGRSEVEDCVQETFVRLVRDLPRFDRARALRPFVLGVARHVARAVKEVAPERLVVVRVTEWPSPDPVGARAGRPLFGFSRAGAGGGVTSWDGATEVGEGTTESRADAVRSDGSVEPCEWPTELAVLDPEQARAIADGPLAPIVADVGPHVVTLERCPTGSRSSATSTGASR